VLCVWLVEYICLFFVNTSGGVYYIYYTYSTLLPANLLTYFMFCRTFLLPLKRSFSRIASVKLVLTSFSRQRLSLLPMITPTYFWLPWWNRHRTTQALAMSPVFLSKEQSFPPVPREVTGYSARNSVARASFAVIREGKVDIWLRRVCMISRTGPHAVNSCL